MELKKDPELVGTNPDQKNWRGIIIAVLVILLVLALIVVAVIVVTPKRVKTNHGDPFTLDHFYNNEYKPRQASVQWMGEKATYVYKSRESEIMAYNVTTNTTTLIMDNSTFRELNSDVYFMSEDLRYVLLAYDVQQVFRHSFQAKYIIYDSRARTAAGRIIPFPTSTPSLSWRNKKLQFAGWSKTGSALTFVYGNNLYYQSTPNTSPTQMTTSGQLDSIYNGLSDWLYEEEILHSSCAHWLSPGGARIAYAQFDDTDVPKYKLPMYGSPTSVYGDIKHISYPKAGDPASGINPRVAVYVAEAGNPGGQHVLLPAPRDRLAFTDYLLNDVIWQDGNHTLVVWSNRQQNKTFIMHCDVREGRCSLNLELSARGRGWVDAPSPMFIDDGRSYLAVLPTQDGNSGFWRHIVRIPAEMNSSGSRSYLTRGMWDVIQVVGYSSRRQAVYFIGTNNDPKTRHLFQVTATPTSATSPVCLTCTYIPTCQWFSAIFNRDGRYYVITCEGPDVPWSMLKSTEDDRELMIEDNADLRERLETMAMPVVEYHTIPLDDGQDITAKVLLPPKLNKDHITQYPMLVYTYGSPGTQHVTERFHVGFETFLTSAEQVIYVMVDGHGSLGRGDTWLHSIYRHLGTLEVDDQIVAARFLRDILPYVDSSRVAIWGWSYGGFVTSLALSSPDNDVFSCGVAVAPVTDFRYYDTAYTERYMGLANSEDNYKGYDNTNVAIHAANFEGKHFMLVHGTADDNVHFQNTAQLIKALVEADVDFRVQTYFDQNHALSGPKTSRHLYRTLHHFLRDECWDGGQPKGPVNEDGEHLQEA